MTITNNYDYTGSILCVLQKRKMATLHLLKESIPTITKRGVVEQELQTCLDDLVTNGKIFVRKYNDSKGRPTVMYYLDPAIGRKFCNANRTVNSNDNNGDDCNATINNCDGKKDGDVVKEEPKTIAQPQQQIEKACYIALTEIVLSDDFRCRVQEDEDTVDDYTEVLTDYKEASDRGKSSQYPFPPAWVWYDEDGQVYLLAGFHRYKATEKAKFRKLLVKEFKGTREEAILFAMRDNRKHGKRLSSGDLKYCIEKALRLFPTRTPGVIAKDLGCHRSYAYKIEKELSTSRQLTEVEEREGADGKKRSVKRKGKKTTVVPPSEPANKSAVAPLEETDNKPKSDPPNDKREATSEPVKPIPLDASENNEPFKFDIPSPVAPVEDIAPSSPELERKTNSIINYIRSTLSDWGKEPDDCRYILHRIKEYIKCITDLEAEADKTTPSNGEPDSA